MRTTYALPALAAAVALLLTGCVDNSTDSSGSATTSANTIAKDVVAVALLPSDVAATGTLSISIDPNYAPNEYKDNAGDPIGWDVEIASAIAAKLGLTADFQISKFDNIIPSVTGEKVNIGVSSFTDTVEREVQVDFVDYYTAGVQWASASGTEVDPDNACGLRVAVQSTTYQDTDDVPQRSDACVAAGKEPIEKLQYETQDEATNAVVLGQADALSADSPVTQYAIAQTKGKLQAAGGIFDSAPYGVALAKDSALTPAIQAALQSLVDDGSYAAILDSWGVGDGGVSEITINAAAIG